MSILVVVLGGIVAIDNILAQIPALKANSSFQLVSNLINELFAALKKPAA